MAVDGRDGRRRGKREEGKELVVEIRFSLDVENEQADAGRDSQTCFARLNSQARTEKGKNIFFPLFSRLNSG